VLVTLLEVTLVVLLDVTLVVDLDVPLPDAELVTVAELLADPPGPDAELLEPARYRHDIGAGWLWLAATKGGNFGPVEQVLSEREMRAHDTGPSAAELEPESPAPTPRPAGPTGQCFGVRPRGTELTCSTGPHYPDLLLITPSGRVPIELEPSRPATQRLSGIMTGYAAQPNIRSVLYMTDDQRVAHVIKTVSGRLGISALIHLQRISIPAGEPA
jgi:hypothetical protein